ncbi:MAG: VOC family protein [Hyphomicrobiaceae bacterium]
MVKSKSAVPHGYQAVMPYLRVRDAGSAIKFYKKALGATESYRLKMGGKIGHAELVIGGSVVMLSDEFPNAKAENPKSLKGTSVVLTLYVDDVDKAVAKAAKAGAKVRKKAADQFYGDRTGEIVDPFGHVWMLHARLEEVEPKEMQKRLNAMMKEATAKKPGRGKKAAKTTKATKVKTATKTTRTAAGGAKKSTARTPAKTTAVRKKAAAKGSARKAAKVPAKSTPGTAPTARRSTARKPVGSRRRASSARRGRPGR